MQEYNITPSGFKEIRKLLLIKIVPFILIAVTAVIIISLFDSTDKVDTSTLTFVIIIVALVLGLSVYRSIQKQKAFFESYSLIIKANMVTRTQLNTRTISIYLNDIIEINKNKNGNFVIKGKYPDDIIVIRAQIDKYDQLEEALNQIKPITQTSKSFRKIYSLLIALVTITSMIFVYSSSNKIIVAISGLSFTGIMAWGFIEIRNNKNIDENLRRKIWLILVVIALVLIRMIYKINGIQ
ncbi:hypothetical protein ACPPVU_11090 [Mucilaginibacter sp. McL0603]|uniref:hypothetical protein n=1 Tax=Mucilaginibacter sp. McL0603 TaxID=3415670 RepID=UPI003CF309E8